MTQIISHPRAGHWVALPLEGRFEVVYQDQTGRYSIRTLDARELKVGLGKALLGGRVEGSGAYRGFRLDRIRRLTDLESGEVVDWNVTDWLLRYQTRWEKRALLAA